MLELRIHGVGGSPPEVNLEHPSTIQVAGDNTAGFYRAWIPGGAGSRAPRREAYCWGKLNYRSASRALWLLLVAYMIINMAQWALPATRRPGATTENPRLNLTNTVARSILRVIALLLTVAMIATLVTVLGDLLAWQAPVRGALPSWLRWYGGWRLGPRLAVALLATLVLLAGLHLTSIRTARSYEWWRGGARPDYDERWPLTRPNFWNGARNVARQRGCHVGAGASYVALIAALPEGSHPAVRAAAIATAIGLGGAATMLVASPWTDRRRVTQRDRQGLPDVLCSVVGIAASVLAVGLCIARMWWIPSARNTTLPGDLILQVCILWAGLGLVLVLAVLVVMQRPWRQADVMGFGLAAPLLALLATLVSGIFGAAFTLTLANIVGSPKAALGALPRATARTTLYVPTTVYSYGFGFLVTAGGLLVTVVGAVVVRAVLGRRLAAGPVAAVYAETIAGGELADPGRTGQARRAVGNLWSQARLTDHVAVPLGITALPTAVGIATYQIQEMADAGHHLPRALLVASSVGSTVAIAVTALFLVQLRAALRNAQLRKRIGLIWDVGTFWPRACHPFAPPCYAERSIPEVVNRIRHVVGDEWTTSDPLTAVPPSATPVGLDPADGLREQHSPVLLSGYSQGSPISVAVLAQLPCSALDRVGLLTLAAPVRRLYGRAFPAYFGADALTVLVERLTDSSPGSVRWRNVVRRSDYIGGWVLTPIAPGTGAAGPIDREILDPPSLWADDDPTPPPSHLHSDWFADPQTRPFADQVMTSLLHR